MIPLENTHNKCTRHIVIKSLKLHLEEVKDRFRHHANVKANVFAYTELRNRIALTTVFKNSKLFYIEKKKKYFMITKAVYLIKTL